MVRKNVVALMIKHFYQNGDSAPEALRRFRALKNILTGKMTGNEKLAKILESIFSYALNILKKLLRMTVEHAILRIQLVLDNNGEHTEEYLP